jgi:cytochrome d ubiquinol oxidase subunit II
METFWFVAVALMLTVYVVLDGFDLGAGIVHHVVAKREAERRGILRAIGPVWNGNEVWLIGAGARCSSASRCSMRRASAASTSP